MQAFMHVPDRPRRGGLATGYLAASFLSLVRGLGWSRGWSPFSWGAPAEALQHAPDALHLGLLVGTTAVATALAGLALARRDVAV